MSKIGMPNIKLVFNKILAISLDLRKLLEKFNKNFSRKQCKKLWSRLMIILKIKQQTTQVLFPQIEKSELINMDGMMSMLLLMMEDI